MLDEVAALRGRADQSIREAQTAFQLRLPSCARERRLASVRIDAIVFDCHDAAPLARFWAAALGWSVAPYDEEELARLRVEGVFDPEDDPTVMVEPPEDSDLPVLFLVGGPRGQDREEPDAPGHPGRRRDRGRGRTARGLGATLRNWAEGGGSVWCVMLDPEGNEFCVMPPDDDVA